jgi:hypothetical protein
LKIDLKVAADGSTGLLKLAAERVGAQLPLRVILRVQHDDANSPLSLLSTLRRGGE